MTRYASNVCCTGQKISISCLFCMFILFLPDFSVVFLFSLALSFVRVSLLYFVFRELLSLIFASCFVLFLLLFCIFFVVFNICWSFCLFLVPLSLFECFYLCVFFLTWRGPLCANQAICVPHANIKTITIAPIAWGPLAGIWLKFIFVNTIFWVHSLGAHEKQSLSLSLEHSPYFFIGLAPLFVCSCNRRKKNICRMRSIWRCFFRTTCAFEINLFKNLCRVWFVHSLKCLSIAKNFPRPTHTAYASLSTPTFQYAFFSINVHTQTNHVNLFIFPVKTLLIFLSRCGCRSIVCTWNQFLHMFARALCAWVCRYRKFPTNPSV